MFFTCSFLYNSTDLFLYIKGENMENSTTSKQPSWLSNKRNIIIVLIVLLVGGFALWHHHKTKVINEVTTATVRSFATDEFDTTVDYGEKTVRVKVKDSAKDDLQKIVLYMAMGTPAAVQTGQTLENHVQEVSTWINKNVGSGWTVSLKYDNQLLWQAQDGKLTHKYENSQDFKKLVNKIEDGSFLNDLAEELFGD